MSIQKRNRYIGAVGIGQLTRVAVIALVLVCLFGWATVRSVQGAAGDDTESVADQSASRVTTSEQTQEQQTAASASTEEVIVSIPQERWNTAGIKLSPAARGAYAKTISVTGKIGLNQDHIAHVYSMVEGSVDDVVVTLGQVVKAQDLLATIHSREIGEAKLQLYQARLELELAKSNEKLQGEIVSNASELIDALRNNKTIDQIEEQFRLRPMGDFRERALSAYSNYLKSAADVARLEGISDSGAVSGKQLLAAQANLNADKATFQARLEQIYYELGTSTLRMSQAVKEADAKVLVQATSLRILGCSEEEIADINPATQGEKLSHYQLRAPFDGIVLAKDVVLHEQVRPDNLLLTIADLDTVWVTADIYEEHLALLERLQADSVSFTCKSHPGKAFSASVFYKGEVMDEQTRTVPLRAIVDNRDRHHKPGTFVTVHLPEWEDDNALLVPMTALQEHQGTRFVFISKGGGDFARRDVQVASENGEKAVIIDGLGEGEQVVVAGGFILKSLMLAELLGEE